MLQHPRSLLWWVAPLYKELIPASEKIRNLTPPETIEKKFENQNIIRYIKLYNGSEIYFHSADREDSLRGMGLDGLVVDEAAQLKETRWHGELEPSLTDKNGWAIFIGTPKGTNWFSKLYIRGQDRTQNLYESWRFSSYDNAKENGGFIDKQNFDIIANDMPELLRRQEIYGEFLRGEGVVFRNVQRQIKEEIKPYDGNEPVYVGADFGKTTDYTVLCALRANGELVGFDRFSQIDWVFQAKRTVNFAKTYGNARLLIDSTGLGDPIFDFIKRDYQLVEGYKINVTSKKALIENLSLMFDNREIWISNNPVLVNELEIFGYEITSSGNIQYGAPEGYHDDCVVALALAAWQLKYGFKPLTVHPIVMFGKIGVTNEI